MSIAHVIRSASPTLTGWPRTVACICGATAKHLFSTFGRADYECERCHAIVIKSREGGE